MPVSNDRQLTPEERERVKALETAYNALIAELDTLSRKGHVLREELQHVVDKHKMKAVLESIIHTS